MEPEFLSNPNIQNTCDGSGDQDTKTEAKFLSEEQKPDLEVGLAYWDSISRVDLTNNGVLGGYGSGSLPRIDSLGSRLFLLKLLPKLSKIKSPIETNKNIKKTHNKKNDFKALEVGSGIGRVSKDVLINFFNKIDLLEPIPKFLDQSKLLLSQSLNERFTIHQSQYDDKGYSERRRSIRFWCQSVQEFDFDVSISKNQAQKAKLESEVIRNYPEKENDNHEEFNDGTGYDIIWAQWTLGHLSDEELIIFFKKCKLALKKKKRHSRDNLMNTDDCDDEDDDGGYLIVKENIYRHLHDPDGDYVTFDEVDSSVTRSNKRFLKLFEESDLTLVMDEIQNGFDPDLYSVKFYVLQ